MKLLIIRHGDPDYVNDTLTEKGRIEADLLSEKLINLNIKSFYCSPLGRAIDTSLPTLKKYNATAKNCDWLQEFPAYYINPENNTKEILWDLKPSSWTKENSFYNKDNWSDADIYKTGNGLELYKKVCNSLDDLLYKHGYKRQDNYYIAENSNSDTIALFCHFGVECVLLSHLLGISPVVLWHQFVALPSSVTTLITEEREKGIASFRCNSFGDTSHLYKHNVQPSFAARFCECYNNFNERH